MNINNYIITLTTIPTKFDNLYMTIDSIISQTLLPNKIIINIPKIYNFRMNNSQIPKDKIDEFMNKYSKYNIYINELNEDYGPGTKLLGLLNSEITNNFDIYNTYIVLVDDDVIYKPYFLEHFNKYIQNSYNIEIASYCVYNRGFNIGQGVDGFFIKLNTLDKFLQYYDIIKEEDYIKYHDDVYISYYFYLIQKHLHHITAPNNCLIYNTQPNYDIDALRNIGGDYNRENCTRKSIDILNTLHNNGEFSFSG